ncbi:MAG: RNA pseudouridine synthase [Candidatus Eisenbacteria bacterium]
MSSGGPGPDRIAGIPVAFRTEHEVVLVKPAGIASELTSDPKRVSLLSRMVDAGLSEARLPHRLDRGTRGFLLVALTSDAIRFHNERVRERSWRKVYLARVRCAAPRHAALLGEHKAYLKRRGNRMEVVRSGGQPSFLSVLGVHDAPGGGAHAVIELGTGRYHQIRAMMSSLGAPLIGDDAYGGGDGTFYLEHVVFAFQPMEGNRQERAEPPLASRTVTLFDPTDPDREELAAETRELLARCARAGEGESADGGGRGALQK